MDFAKITLFESHAVIYLVIGAAIYDHEVLFVFYSYPNDDMETATFGPCTTPSTHHTIDNL